MIRRPGAVPYKTNLKSLCKKILKQEVDKKSML